MRSLSVLVASMLLIAGCRTTPVKYDKCQVIYGGAYCYPQNKPDTDEYQIGHEQMIGGWFVSAEDEGKLQEHYIDLVERCEK